MMNAYILWKLLFLISYYTGKAGSLFTPIVTSHSLWMHFAVPANVLPLRYIEAARIANEGVQLDHE